MTELRLKLVASGKVALWYGHLRWAITFLVSLIWLLYSGDLGTVPVVALPVYLVAHYPALLLATLCTKQVSG